MMTSDNISIIICGCVDVYALLLLLLQNERLCRSYKSGDNFFVFLFFSPLLKFSRAFFPGVYSCLYVC